MEEENKFYKENMELRIYLNHSFRAFEKAIKEVTDEKEKDKIVKKFLSDILQVENKMKTDGMLVFSNGMMGNSLAYAILSHFYVAAKTLLEHREQFSFSLRAIAYWGSNQWSIDELFEASKSTCYVLRRETYEEIVSLAELIKAKDKKTPRGKTKKKVKRKSTL